MDEINVSIGRTEEFFNALNEMGDFVDNLPISNEQHNKLTKLTINQLTAAEKGAFQFGIRLMAIALAIADSEEREPDENDLRRAYEMYLEQENGKCKH